MNYAEDRLDRKARYSNSTSNELESSRNLIQRDLRAAHSVLKPPTTYESTEETLSRLKKGHELAARTLRDCGKCHQATVHYGMAWMCDVEDDKSAGK